MVDAISYQLQIAFKLHQINDTYFITQIIYEIANLYHNPYTNTSN